MNPRLSFFIDFVIFQLAWFACVLATISPFPYLLPLIGTLLVIIRSIYTRGFRKVFPFALVCFLIGILGDGILVRMDLLSFESYPSIFSAPLWMIALWVNFGLMLHPLFTWFLENYWRSIIGFSLGGLIAYYSGQKLEVLTLTTDLKSSFGVALEWAIAGFLLRSLHLKIPSHKL